MTRDESGFLRRWSERKRAARASEPLDPPTELPAPIDEAVAPEPFDPANLPALESLDGSSDYTAFLRPGVPLEMTKAALRQAWRSDPVISTFKEMADYDWDFNAPGYGALLPTDDVQAMLGRIIDRPEPAAEPEPTPEQEPIPELASDQVEDVAIADAGPTNLFVAPPVPEPREQRPESTDNAAPQHVLQARETKADKSVPMLQRPRHGGARPS